MYCDFLNEMWGRGWGVPTCWRQRRGLGAGPAQRGATPWGALRRERVLLGESGSDMML